MTETTVTRLYQVTGQKKAFVHTGKFQFVGPPMEGVESLEKEIITLAKMISGTTGIPVHHLGLPDLMSNRSTAEDMTEMIQSATQKERETWKGTYEELIRKAMVLYNNHVNKGMSKGRQLDPSKISVDIPVTTKEHWDHVEKVFLPAVIAGKISDDLFLEKIPGVDVEAEMKRKEEKEASEIERIKGENESLKSDLADKELFGGGEKNAIPAEKD